MKILVIISSSLLVLIGCTSARSFHPVATPAIPQIEQKIYFPFDSDEFDESQLNIIKKAAEVLGQRKGLKIIVEGHTDSVGSADYNKELGDRRARRILVELIRAGVDSNQLIVVSEGEERPVASNATSPGRAGNRRVELVVRK